MEWQPETQGLNELLNLLQDAIHPSNCDRELVQNVNSQYFLYKFVFLHESIST